MQEKTFKIELAASGSLNALRSIIYFPYLCGSAACVRHTSFCAYQVPAHQRWLQSGVEAEFGGAETLSLGSARSCFRLIRSPHTVLRLLQEQLTLSTASASTLGCCCRRPSKFIYDRSVSHVRKQGRDVADVWASTLFLAKGNVSFLHYMAYIMSRR